MTKLTHRSTGHTIRTDEASVEFWQGAGYVLVEEKKPRRATTRKAADKAAEKSDEK